MGVLGVNGFFGKQLLGLCVVGEASVQGGEEQEGEHAAFSGGSLWHTHTLCWRLNPPSKALLRDTEGPRAVPVPLISETAGLCYMDISR